MNETHNENAISDYDDGYGDGYRWMLSADALCRRRCSEMSQKAGQIEAIAIVRWFVAFILLACAVGTVRWHTWLTDLVLISIAIAFIWGHFH